MDPRDEAGGRNTAAADPAAASQPRDPRDPSFLREVERVKKRIGCVPLTDDELIALACEEISRTYTREERNYRDSGE